MDQQLE